MGMITGFVSELAAYTKIESSCEILLARDTSHANAPCEIELSKGCELRLVEILCDGAKSNITIKQQSDSQLFATILQLGSSEVNYTIDLNGVRGECNCDIAQLVTETETAKAELRIAHNSADCNSQSRSKCVAGGDSQGVFKGLVYVAQDAQRTTASQNSRNIALSGGAKIIAEPMLEIYADDVKCSHGATVGEMNQDAILYMRQRGLSEEQARKLQLEGFVGDVVAQCKIEHVKESLGELVDAKLRKL